MSANTYIPPRRVKALRILGMCFIAFLFLGFLMALVEGRKNTGGDSVFFACVGIWVSAWLVDYAARTAFFAERAAASLERIETAQERAAQAHADAQARQARAEAERARWEAAQRAAQGDPQ